MERCDVLGGISEEPGLLVRPYGSGAMRRANEAVAGWMEEAGMAVRRDAIGNLIGRYEGRNANAKTLVLGSHLDTVRDAGKYDGPLGVLVAIACVERLHERGERLPFAVEVVAFADEEGLRFGTAYLGSSAYAGAFDPELLDLKDREGVTLREAIRAFGGDPESVGSDARGGDLLGYFEVHIEQGPVLEGLGLPVGVVSGISGQSRVRVGFSGEAGHAGTVPMRGRRDALCAAAEFVLAVEGTALGEEGAVATVGEISARPGASNVIPGEVDLSLDVRHPDDATREGVVAELRRRAEGIAQARRVEPRWREGRGGRAMPADPGLTGLLSRAAEGVVGEAVPRLPSGAGHDAAQVAEVAPFAMLFVRCRGGVSHSPAESVSEGDVAAAIEVTDRFLALLAEGQRWRPRGGAEGGKIMTTQHLKIDRERSAHRMGRDVEVLSGPEYTRSEEAIRRYAYTPEYRRALDYFVRELEALGFETREDPVGNLVARNRPPGEPAFGVGSHCDSNRNGGRFDGTLGVVAALEVCRLNEELGLGLPLQLISFLEEEGSGFGQMLLGSRVVAGRVTDEELREKFTAVDDGRSFWEHAEEAGYEPGRWREAARILDGMVAWTELHIEQARVLQDTGNRLGVVNAIAGYVHADVTVHGRSDHAGATPMDFRQDASLVAAECMLELERLAKEAGKGTVGTVGELELRPNLINAVPGWARFSMDIRGVDEGGFRGVARDIERFAREAAERRGASAGYAERQSLPATPLDGRVAGALEEAAAASGEPYMVMHSGAAHDTMSIADRVPSAMVFVPCKDGISHSPEEDADPADAALGVEVMLNAIVALSERR